MRDSKPDLGWNTSRMTRICGHPTLAGTPCKHPVADPSQPDCGRHSVPAEILAQAQKSGVKSARGHVWLKGGPSSLWCLRHDTPEYQALVELGVVSPCVLSLGPVSRQRVAQSASLNQLGWAASDKDEDVRQQAAWRMPPDQLEWAARDKSWRVRLTAAERMPENQLEWAARDEDWAVRETAAQRMPPGQLEWATHDLDPSVRLAAAERMPPEELEWATQDPDPYVRQAAAERISPDQLE